MAFGGGFGSMIGGAGGGNVIGSAAVRLLLDSAQMEKGLKGAQARIHRFGKGMSTVGGALTRGVSLPLAGAAIAAIKFASDAAETENKVRVTFGKMADEILQWSNTSIEKIGLAKQGAQDMASQFGLLFAASKLPGPEVVELSKQFTQLAGDMSSFFNVPFEEALTTLRSGLVGETEPLRRFGVLLSEARIKGEAMRLGLVKQGEALTEQQKVQVRSSLIMGDLSKAQGDFARTSDDVANRSRSAKERLKEMAAEIGEGLLPVTKDALGAVQGLLKGFMNLSEGTRENILKFGLLAIALGPVLRLLGSLAVLASPGGALLVGFAGLTAAIVYAQGATERYEASVAHLADRMRSMTTAELPAFEAAYRKSAEAMIKMTDEQTLGIKILDTALQGYFKTALSGTGIIKTFGEQALRIQADAHKKVQTEMTKELAAVQFLDNALAAHNKTLTVGEVNSIKSAIAHKNYALVQQLLKRETDQATSALDAQGRGLDALSRNSNDATNATMSVVRAHQELIKMARAAAQAIKNEDDRLIGLATRFKNMPPPPNVTPTGGGGGGVGTGPLPTHHMGGPINRTGPALLQRGEFVLSRQMLSALNRPSGGGGTTRVLNVNFYGNVYGTADFDRHVTEALGREASRFAGT